MKPSQVQNAVYNGHAYKIIFEKATTQHPEGSRIAVYLDDDATHPKELWIHSALPFEKDEDLSRPAHQKAKEHAEANFPK
jgi:hypothetical protein